MSRIGKKPIDIPSGIEVTLDDHLVEVKGPKGELTKKIHPLILVEKNENSLSLKPQDSHRFSQSLWGLSRTLVHNMVLGVTDGFEKKLEFHGVGYRAQVEKKNGRDNLVLNIGFSHPVEIPAPENINFTCEKNIITISGIDKELVGQVAAKIRSTRPPEPYKGKGIKYLDEQIRRKEGKAIASAGGEE